MASYETRQQDSEFQTPTSQLEFDPREETSVPQDPTPMRNDTLSHLKSDLQTKKQRDLLDAIDRLRGLGLSAELSLPQLIVCGDTSSGKSSVLEAISRVPFPAYDGLCTKFASELVLRRAEERKFSVRIIPANDRSSNDRHHLEALAKGCNDVEDFPRVIKEISTYLSELKQPGSFFEDTVVAEVRGPALPPLTLVDLPGLIHSSNKGESTVKKIVQSYVDQPNSIILAVVAANNSLENQEIIRLVKKYDPSLSRSLGIVTKPDLTDDGSPSEILAINCVKNEYLPFEHGWHVLKNRGFTSKETSSHERDTSETHYFATSNWNSIPENNRGARALKAKLSDLLLKAISCNLPNIRQDIKKMIKACESRAKALGVPLTTDDARRHQLLVVSGNLHSLAKDGMNGNYRDKSFFYVTSENIVDPRRLRACLKGHLTKFAKHMHSHGKCFESTSDPKLIQTTRRLNFSSCSKETDIFEPTIMISEQDLKESIELHITQNRGTEPDDTSLPDIVYPSVLSFQCARWESIATECAQGCVNIAREFFTRALAHKNPSHIAAALMDSHVESYFDAIESELMDKLQELLRPYKNQKFYTLNRTGLKAQKSVMKQPNGTRVGSKVTAEDSSGMSEDSDAAQKVLNWVSAAYEVALSTFLDNFATLAVEFCLVEKLPNIFSQTEAGSFSKDMLEELTREPSDIAKDRSENERRLQTLKDALKVCNQNIDRLDSYSTAKPKSGSTVIPLATRPKTRINNDEVAIQGPPRTGTTDTITQQLQALHVSPPSPTASPSPEAPSTAKKAKSPALLPGPTTLTPPKTPPGEEQLPTGTDERARSASSNEGAKRRTREYGRSPSHLFPKRKGRTAVEAGDTSSEEL